MAGNGAEQREAPEFLFLVAPTRILGGVQRGAEGCRTGVRRGARKGGEASNPAIIQGGVGQFYCIQLHSTPSVLQLSGGD
jgi:hypothetical protein